MFDCLKIYIRPNVDYTYDDSLPEKRICRATGLVVCFGLNGPLRQYFSLYRAVSQREGEGKEK